MTDHEFLTPSPLVGEGQGEGFLALAGVIALAPQPSPRRGKGAGKSSLVMVYGSFNGIGTSPALQDKTRQDKSS